MINEDVELRICRELSHKSAFVLGFARSNTTIVLRIINSAPTALLLGEANFYLQPHQPRFRDWYNAMHSLFDNQVSKSSYAPDFIPGVDHGFAEWLLAATTHYDLVGDKMAFSSQHFGYRRPAVIRAFHEARFFNSRYVLTLREPVPNMLSMMQLLGTTEPQTLRLEMVSWLEYIQLWADIVRTFPNTLSIAGAVGEEETTKILDFLGLSSPDASRLVDSEEKRRHGDRNRYRDLELYGDAMDEIYQHAVSAIAENPVYWQAGQKMSLVMNDTRTSLTSGNITKPRHLGQAWAKAAALRATLEEAPP